MLITSGITYVPPNEVVTNLAGVAGVDISRFVIVWVLSRGVRFFTLAWAFATAARRCFLKFNLDGSTI
jgi:membrane protein YqaA with SNARE-associated domain